MIILIGKQNVPDIKKVIAANQDIKIESCAKNKNDSRILKLLNNTNY